jgi:oxygen-independent coproporphyrinogen-3 oxidase
MNSIGLYIHIPYCLHKCGYCDFNSHNIDREEMDSFVQALLLEMQHSAWEKSERQEITSIFIGGGTPTTLSPQALGEIMAQCRKCFPIAEHAEITIEANPATVEKEPLASIRSFGINRISIGVQSFDPLELKLLERVHSVDEIHQTVDRARQAGFDNLSLDLMFALPGQTLERWKSNLALALEKNPDHLSTYNLTIEQGTAFHKLWQRGQLKLPEEDEQLEQYQESIRTLTHAGYQHYEISNFCKPGRECRHNITYWHNNDCLGLGPGASSYLNGVRFKNCNLPSRYIREINSQGSAKEFEENLEPQRAMGETLMLGLRLLQGVSIDRFEQRFQTSFRKVYGETLDSLLQKNLIELSDQRVALSPKGLFLADSVILEFISPEPINIG